ncbi:2-amino-4-hydroxy-6-hydroxymethyldihydropteridine diphosphokinase [Erythrobacter sp. SCSIO 43205]|uniref:2-amino-4-hydroxy-6- hydroxymethyldihydropteridine diphosphokinase n=1 Tax=Erythrobacter sp. SCSIO 43205 TaxID=2779361 RepID=UPI001CA82718|nr:2-amino-4-hydroxy-6-hydroxymethyldihydropteridine diphosphokinase [Erythrobacter sp. SCSIO 43205]UAB78786.1 2-amino-4-hydroxy-6-hydroxymethyldihydropteridine diphosphokinase [Erythrobacter sp. SCSIO 43205]
MSSSYLVALGSNQRHHRFGRPRDVVGAALEELAALGTVTARSRIITTDPIGPAQRRFANAACILTSDYDPPSLLAGLKMMEREFGRRSGQRWGDRVLDLDIIMWSGGRFVTGNLAIPHKEFRARSFVLEPALNIAGDWRDPVCGLSIAHHFARLQKAQRKTSCKD